MSSHREAPGISKDPVADNTDLYAFVSPDKSGWVTILANFIPLEFPAGGPNFFEFGDDVTYDINISNDRSRDTDITYRFRFETVLRNDDTFLYNTGPISSLNDPNWTAGSSTRSPGSRAAPRPCWRTTWRAPRSTSVRGRPPTTTSSPRPRSTP